MKYVPWVRILKIVSNQNIQIPSAVDQFTDEDMNDREHRTEAYEKRILLSAHIAGKFDSSHEWSINR